MRFVSWVTPLLDPLELLILKEHTQRAPDGRFMLRDRAIAVHRFRHSIQRLQDVVRKLNGLAYMYELEVAAGLIT